MNSKNAISFIYKLIKYNFKNDNILIEALTHPSVRSENIKQKTYERLEFLGDTILSFVVADILFKNFTNEDEGLLSKRLVNLVCRDKLHAVAKTINIAPFLIMTLGEEKNNGRENVNSLSDSIESLIAALYIDGGLEVAQRFIKKFWHDDLYNQHFIHDNAKSVLQETLQAQGFSLPNYYVINEVGEDHHPEFTIQLNIQNIGEFFGKAGTKKKAEIIAAENALVYLKKNPFKKKGK